MKIEYYLVIDLVFTKDQTLKDIAKHLVQVMEQRNLRFIDLSHFSDDFRYLQIKTSPPIYSEAEDNVIRDYFTL